MTYKLPDWTLSKSLHLLLDLYERDPAAAHSLLSQDLGFGYLDDDLRRVPLTEQLELLRRASKSTREEILRKTLIQTEGGTVRHTLIAEYVATPERIPDLYKDPDNQSYGLFDDVIAGIATE